MRILSETGWKILEGKLLHIRVNHVYPELPGKMTVEFELLETEDSLTVTAETEE